MKLTVENTAVVLDSTADFPDAEARFPNFRTVPLYVRFGDESFKDYVDITADRFYERLQTDPELPTTSQPTPGDFLATFEELAQQYERILSIQISSTLSGHVCERAVGAPSSRRFRGARDRFTHGFGIARDARDRRAAAARAGHDRRGDRRVRRALPERSSPSLHGEHARLPRTRWPHRPCRGLRREPAECEADPHDPRRRGDPLKRVRGNAKRSPSSRSSSSRPRPTRRTSRSGSRTPRLRTASRHCGSWSSTSTAGGDRDGDSARAGRRHACRPGHGRLLLVEDL